MSRNGKTQDPAGNLEIQNSSSKLFYTSEVNTDGDHLLLDLADQGSRWFWPLFGGTRTVLWETEWSLETRGMDRMSHAHTLRIADHQN